MRSMLILLSFTFFILGTVVNAVFALERGEVDVAKTRAYFKDACLDGNAAVCFGLGKLEYKDDNHVEARKYLRMSCEGGHTKACDEFSELGVSEETAGNYAEAMKYYKAACDVGDTWGCYFFKLMVKENCSKACEDKVEKSCDAFDNF